MNRHHYRLAAVFDAQEEWKKAGAARSARGHLSKFFDIGSGNKRLPSANKDSRVDRRIVTDLFDGVGNSLGHPRAKGIHRWIVDGDDRDLVFVSAQLN